MRVLVACEYSGRVRRAFAERGHEVYSCDLLPADDGETIHHYQGDVFDIINRGWDLMIAHPPCTHLAVSVNQIRLFNLGGLVIQYRSLPVYGLRDYHY